MKVKDLKIGMMLKPAASNRHFVLREKSDWLGITDIPNLRRPSLWASMHPVSHPLNRDIALYLGTRADIGGHKVKWSDRFVLFRNKVIAVDPYTWRHISPVAQTL
jgi:hypothetical protein